MQTRSSLRFARQKEAITFDKLIKKNLSLPDVFRRATTYGLFDLEGDTYTHQACKVIAGDADILMWHVQWDFKEIIPALNDPQRLHDIYEITEGGLYTRGFDYKEFFLHIQLADAMDKGKIIYIVLSIENYGLDILDGGNEYGHHSTSLIFYPRGINRYDCFYINSHGEDMTLTNFYDVYKTRRRYTRHSFDEPIDVICIKRYLEFLRASLLELECRVNIVYDGTKRHNYYGPNLQCGDDHGVCFAFPLIIWYYLSNFYTRERILKDNTSRVIIPPFEVLLDRKELITLVNSCFTVFHKKIENEVLNNAKVGRARRVYLLSGEENSYRRVHKYTQLTYDEIALNKSIESIIIKSGTIFVKRIALGIVRMLTHSYIKKIIY